MIVRYNTSIAGGSLLHSQSNKELKNNVFPWLDKKVRIQERPTERKKKRYKEYIKRSKRAATALATTGCVSVNSRCELVNALPHLQET